jgi:hypothetical protein
MHVIGWQKRVGKFWLETNQKNMDLWAIIRTLLYMIKGNYKQLSWIPIVAGSYSIHLQTWYLKVNNRDCTAWNRSYRLKLDKNELVDTHAQFIWIPTNQSLDFTEKGITGKKENNSKYRVLHELALTSE